MQKTMTALVALALVATVAPVAQATTPDFAEENLAWLMATYPEAENFAPETIDMFLERSSRADLSAVISASGDAGNHAGDVWVIGFGLSSCPANNVIAPGTGQFVPIHTQLWLYPYPVQQVTATGSSMTVIGWTSKSTGFGTTVDTLGVTDNFCYLDFFTGQYIYYPWINGVVS